MPTLSGKQLFPEETTVTTRCMHMQTHGELLTSQSRTTPLYSLCAPASPALATAMRPVRDALLSGSWLLGSEGSRSRTGCCFPQCGGSRGGSWDLMATH